jgi:MoxR-like ATPase
VQSDLVEQNPNHCFLTMNSYEPITGVDDLTTRLAQTGYLVDDGLATALTLAVRMRQPLLLEGEAGVGKTESAKSLAIALNAPLIRLQCYEGVELSDALYEWNYPRQLLAIRLAESSGAKLSDADLFTTEYLVERPVLQALNHAGPGPAVLLIDEVDRADDEFEAFLLEMLAESSVTIPELGTIRALHPPVVILTSNRTRDLHDALKRRCLYHWIDFPSIERAADIVRLRVPESAIPMAQHVAASVARLRTLDLQKSPGIAEAISWANALDVLGFAALDATSAAATLGTVVKYRDDADVVADRGFDWLVGSPSAVPSSVSP